MVSGSLGCEGFGVGGKVMMVSSVVLVTYYVSCIMYHYVRGGTNLKLIINRYF